MSKTNEHLLTNGIGWSIKGKILDAMRRFDEAENAHKTSMQILADLELYDLAHSKLAFGQHYIMRDGELSNRAQLWLSEALAIFERLGSKREIKKIRALLAD